MRIKYIKVIFVIIGGILAITGLKYCVISTIGGAYCCNPEQINRVSSGARRLIDNAFRDVRANELVDYHTHIIGSGSSNSGIFINPDHRTLFHPLKYFIFHVYLSATGIQNWNRADEEYMKRLLKLIRHTPKPGRYYILAFDKYYSPDGGELLERTGFYVPNAYVFDQSQKYNKYLLPAISIHPYRPDALIELEKWARKGVRILKWLPNAMGINPFDDRIIPFYRLMKKYNMILLTHAGEEKAVEAEEEQKFGNPLLLRKPLDLGLRVIVAHCAGLGKNIDLESREQKKINNFDLFMRLMDEKKYQGLLFGDISAMTQANRLPGPLATIIRREDLHHRLVNGSDYPLPALNIVIRTRTLMNYGFITKEEREYLNEIYDYNPLLFDYVLKRTLRAPGSDKKLSPSIFMKNRNL